MKPIGSLSDDEGSAIVDLVGFGILLQIPILLFATLAISHQHESFALEAIARHSLRALSLTADYSAIDSTISQLASEFGLDETALSWWLECLPAPDCDYQSELVSLRVTYKGAASHAAYPIFW